MFDFTPPLTLNRRPQREIMNTDVSGFIDTQLNTRLVEVKIQMRLSLWILVTSQTYNSNVTKPINQVHP
jgi:hypothetical protein